MIEILPGLNDLESPILFVLFQLEFGFELYFTVSFQYFFIH